MSAFLQDRKSINPTIAIAAGKGGTGKTLLSVSFALALHRACPGRVQLLDCDVEEPNAHLLLRPVMQQEAPVTISVPRVDLDTCTRCGRCSATCQYSAIAVIRQAVLVFPELCSGCGACSYVCPAGAIAEVERQVGTVATGDTADGLRLHMGYLNVGDARATPVTKAVKNFIRKDMITLLDAPPGTACPMQETVDGSDYCILVTEPTPFGRSDLAAAVQTCRRAGVPCGIIINRYGSGYTGVEEYCAEEGLDLLARIPQQRNIAEAYSRGQALPDVHPVWHKRLLDIMDTVFHTIEMNKGDE